MISDKKCFYTAWTTDLRYFNNQRSFSERVEAEELKSGKRIEEMEQSSFHQVETWDKWREE